MEKSILLGLIGLLGAPLCAMDLQKKVLEKLTFSTDIETKIFTDYVTNNELDIDTVRISKTQTFAGFLNEHYTSAHHALDASKKTHITGIRTAVERYRSNPPHADILRKQVKEALADSNKLADLKAFVQGKQLNIDRIAFEPSTSAKTIGAVLDGYVRDAAQDLSTRAKDVLALDEIKKFRPTHLGTRVRQSRVKELLKVAFTTDADMKKFIDYATEHLIDIDTVKFSKKRTLIQFMEKLEQKSTPTVRTHKPGTPIREIERLKLKENIKAAVRARIKSVTTALERYRSNPPEVDTLRNHVKEALADGTKLAALKTFLHGKQLNVDRIVYEPGTSTKTIGAVLDAFRHDLKDQDQLKRARDILLLDDIKNFRAKPLSKTKTLRTHIIDALIDGKDFDALQKYYDGSDVDYIAMDHTAKSHFILGKTRQDLPTLSAKSIGDELDEHASDPLAHKILGLVRPHRRKEMKKFGDLLEAYKKDKKKLAD